MRDVGDGESGLKARVEELEEQNRRLQTELRLCVSPPTEYFVMCSDMMGYRHARTPSPGLHAPIDEPRGNISMHSPIVTQEDVPMPASPLPKPCPHPAPAHLSACPDSKESMNGAR